VRSEFAALTIIAEHMPVVSVARMRSTAHPAAADEHSKPAWKKLAKGAKLLAHGPSMRRARSTLPIAEIAQSVRIARPCDLCRGVPLKLIAMGGRCSTLSIPRCRKFSH
jgi:hypothetical protein